MAKMNMIESLGVDQINAQFVDAMFLRNDKTYVLKGVYGAGQTQCVCLEDGRAELIDNDYFTGFKVFAYPKLGYRRFGKHSIGYCFKVQSKKRGLTTGRVKVANSPVTARLSAYGFAGVEDRKANKGVIIMRPTFDNPLKLKDLLDGKESGLVLSESVIIEPTVRDINGQFDIWHEQAHIGSIDDAGKFKWYSPKYERLVRPLLAA